MTGEVLLSAAQTGADRGTVTALVAAVLAILWLRHQWHLRRYPERLKCHHCKGTGKITSENMWGTAVRGVCPSCGGTAWIPRRRRDR